MNEPAMGTLVRRMDQQMGAAIQAVRREMEGKRGR